MNDIRNYEYDSILLIFFKYSLLISDPYIHTYIYKNLNSIKIEDLIHINERAYGNGFGSTVKFTVMY